MKDHLKEKAAIIKELQKPLANPILMSAARQGFEFVDLVAAMWELVDDGKLEYVEGSRLVLLEKDEN